MFPLLPFLVVVSISLHGCAGSCWYNPIKNKTTEYGRIRYYCEYTIHHGEESIPMEVMPGSKFNTLDCMECSCDENGLSCCGRGFYAGTVEAPDMCKVVPDGCRAIMVLKSNNKTDCFTRRPVQPFQFSPKGKKTNTNSLIGGVAQSRETESTNPRMPEIAHPPSFFSGIAGSNDPQMSLVRTYLSRNSGSNEPSVFLQKWLRDNNNDNIGRLRQDDNMHSGNFVTSRHFVSSGIPNEQVVRQRHFVSNVSPNDNIVTTRRFVTSVPDDNLVSSRHFTTNVQTSGNITPETENAIRQYIREQMGSMADGSSGSNSHQFVLRPNLADMAMYRRQIANMESVQPRVMPQEGTIRHVTTERRYTGEPIMASRQTSMWPTSSSAKEAQMITTGARSATQKSSTDSDKPKKNNAINDLVLMKLLGVV